MDKILQKIKNWIIVPPKHNIWYYLFWIMFFRSIISRFPYLIIFQLGALQPNMNSTIITPKLEQIANNTVNNLIDPFTTIFKSGQKFGLMPYGNLISHLISYVYIGFLISIFVLIFHGIIRHIIHFIYKKIKRYKKYE
jgi:large-conductance mechanosensitive channel